MYTTVSMYYYNYFTEENGFCGFWKMKLFMVVAVFLAFEQRGIKWYLNDKWIKKGTIQTEFCNMTTNFK